MQATVGSLEPLLSIFVCFIRNREAFIVRDHRCNAWGLRAIDGERSREEVILFIAEEGT